MAGAARSPIAVVCVPVVYATPPPRPCPVTPTPVVFALMVDVPASFTTDSLLNVVAPAMITGHRLSLAHAASCAARTLYKVLLPTLRTRATCPTPKPAPSIVLAASSRAELSAGLRPSLSPRRYLAANTSRVRSLIASRSHCETTRAEQVHHHAPCGRCRIERFGCRKPRQRGARCRVQRCGKGRVRNGSADLAY